MVQRFVQRITDPANTIRVATYTGEVSIYSIETRVDLQVRTPSRPRRQLRGLGFYSTSGRRLPSRADIGRYQSSLPGPTSFGATERHTLP